MENEHTRRLCVESRVVPGDVCVSASSLYGFRATTLVAGDRTVVVVPDLCAGCRRHDLQHACADLRLAGAVASSVADAVPRRDGMGDWRRGGRDRFDGGGKHTLP